MAVSWASKESECNGAASSTSGILEMDASGGLDIREESGETD